MSNDDESAVGDAAAEPGADEPVSYDDRRRFPRLAKQCQIRVRPLNGMDPAMDGSTAMTVNISGGGLCYRSGDAVPPGGFVAVELTMPDLDSPVLALARTVFCSPAGPPHDVGLEFWWVGWGDDTAQRAISDLIKTELRHRGDA